MGDEIELGAIPNGHVAGVPSRADVRRQQIIGAAQCLFASHGFHGTGIAQIAARSGVKVGQIYRDFAGKEDIVAAIVNDGLNAFLDDPALHAAIADRDRTAARNWICDLVLRKAHPDQSPLLPEILAEAGRNDRIAAVLFAVDMRVRDSLLSALSVFLPMEAPLDRLTASANLIMTMLTGLCSRRLARLQGDCMLLVDNVRDVIDQEIERLSAPSPAPDPAPPTA